MPCGVGKHKRYVRIRSKDVGRPGHHYIKIGVLPSGKTERIGGLRTYKSASEYKKESKPISVRSYMTSRKGKMVFVKSSRRKRRTK
jgi:hypothetical protein